MSHHLSWTLIVVAFTFGACGSSTVAPHDTLAASEGTIRAAEEVGAKDVPTAALHVQLAKEETDKARIMMKAGNNDRAKFMLMRAQADAELAITLSKEDAATEEASLAMEQVRALQSGKQVIP